MKIAIIDPNTYIVTSGLIFNVIFLWQLGQDLLELNTKNELPKENGDAAFNPQ